MQTEENNFPYQYLEKVTIIYIESLFNYYIKLKK